jgi:hypothetical protein
MSAEEAQYFQELIQSRMSRQCQTELEEAMGGEMQGAISETCKEEVAQIYRSLTQNSGDGEQQFGGDSQAYRGSNTGDGAPIEIKEKPWLGAETAILLFVIMTIIGISTFCYMHRDMIMEPKRDDRSNSQKRKDQKGRR